MCQNVLQLYHFTSNSVSHSCFIFLQALVMVSVFNCSSLVGLQWYFLLCAGFSVWNIIEVGRGSEWFFLPVSNCFCFWEAWQYVDSSSCGDQGISSFEAGSQVWWPVFCFWLMWTFRSVDSQGSQMKWVVFQSLPLSGAPFFQAVFSELGRLLEALLSYVVSKRQLSL